MQTYFTLLFDPHWECISIIRNFINSILLTGITTPDDAGKVAVAGSELLENACKYSKRGHAKIQMQKRAEEHFVLFSVSNITDKESVKRFEQTFQMVYSEEDSKAVYTKMLKQSMLNDNESRLGLARIRHECTAKISYSVERNIEELLTKDDNAAPEPDQVILRVMLQIPGY